MRGLPWLAIASLALVACGESPNTPDVPRQPFTGSLIPFVTLDMAGEFTLTTPDELRLALVHPCTWESSSSRGPNVCGGERLKLIHVIAHTPWNEDLIGEWIDPSHLVFHIDWKTVDLDPLAEATPGVLRQPWQVSGATWTPTSAEAIELWTQLGVATDTEPELVTGGPPPKLEVTSFYVADGKIHTGEQSTFIVQIANHGTGGAFRVVATLRSGIAALHGKRLAFGLIKPNAEKMRKIAITVPTSEVTTSTMIVLAVSEGNGVAPADVHRRFPLEHPSTAPVLAIQCQLEGASAQSSELDAGKSIELSCTLSNTGNGEAKQVEIEAVVAGKPGAPLPPRTVAAAGKTTFRVPVVVPRELPIDSKVEIALTARDLDSAQSVHATVVGTVRKPRLCEPGKLTQAQYQAKLAELRNSKFLSADELDRYDAELVSCLR